MEPGLRFADLLRQLRTEARLTQEELAEQAGLSPRSVSDLERGINRTARKDSALMLASALKLTGPVQEAFVAAARGRAESARVLAVRSGAAPESSAAAARTLPRDIGGFTGRERELTGLATQARQRAPHVALRLFATAVNGVGAVPEIVHAIRAADASGSDLLVVVRGGGSYEDLFGFSDERVVRAIAACATPTVAAIGHERDVPLIELAADVRASTPSTAAQTVLPKRDDLLRTVAERGASARRAFANRLQRARSALDRIEHRSPLADARGSAGAPPAVDVLRNAVDGRCGAPNRALAGDVAAARAAPDRVVTARAVRTAPRPRRRSCARPSTASAASSPSSGGRGSRRCVARLRPAYVRVVARDAARLETLKARFDANNPEALLKRGYAIVTAGGRLVRDRGRRAAGYGDRGATRSRNPASTRRTRWSGWRRTNQPLLRVRSIASRRSSTNWNAKASIWNVRSSFSRRAGRSSRAARPS